MPELIWHSDHFTPSIWNNGFYTVAWIRMAEIEITGKMLYSNHLFHCIYVTKHEWFGHNSYSVLLTSIFFFLTELLHNVWTHWHDLYTWTYKGNETMTFAHGPRLWIVWDLFPGLWLADTCYPVLLNLLFTGKGHLLTQPSKRKVVALSQSSFLGFVSLSLIRLVLPEVV